MKWSFSSRCAEDSCYFEAWGPDDVSTILAIEQTVYSHPWSRGNFVDSLTSGYRCVRWVQGEETLGYHVAMRGPGEMHLLNLTVAPDHQRRGLGRRLLDELIAHCRQENLNNLWLEVRQSNAAAQALYAQAGFQAVGLRRDYYPLTSTSREHAVVMRLNLGPTVEGAC